MINPDYLPPAFWIPLAFVLWAFVLTPVVWAIMHAPLDPNDEPTGLDVLERTGVHPHG